jgi:muramidase (phage lysozyme)
MAGQQSAVPTQRNIMTGGMSPPKGLMTANLPPKQPSGMSQAMSFGKGLADVVGSRGTKDKSGDYSGGSGLAGLYQSGKDFFADKPAAANGGRMAYADGGGDDDNNDSQTNQFKPEADDPLAHQGKMVIPDDNPQAKLATANLPSSGGGGGGLGGLLGGAGSLAMGASKLLPFFGFSDGGLAGREHHADGKTVGDSDGGGSDATPPKDIRIQPQALEDMPHYYPELIKTIYGPESGGRYDIRYGGQGSSGKTFDPEQGHPNIAEVRPDGRTSTASGAGMFLKRTWDDVAGKDAPLSKPYMDAATKALADRDYYTRTGRNLDEDLQKNGVTPEIKQALAGTWEGLKGQQRQSALGAYKKELAPLDEGALGAIQKIPGIGRLAKSEEQGGLSDNAKLAILGGIGGMLASPNRSLLGAIGSGLTSGVEAYQGLGGLGVQQKLANLKEQYAPVGAELTLSEAAAKRAETQRASTAITNFGVFKFGADGKTYSQKEYNELEAQGKAPALLGYVPSDSEKRVREKVGLPINETTTGATGAQPVPKKETAAPTFTPTPTYDEKSQAAAKQDDVTGTTPQAMEAAKEASKNYATNVQQGAQAARDTAIMTRDQIKQLIDNKEKGIVQTGALFNFGAGATNLINSIGRQFGVENVAGNADAQKQVLDKINTLSASQLAALGGQHAVEAMRRLIEASANPTMSPEAWSEILSSLGAQGVRSRDQANHLSQWNKDSGGYSHNAGADFERLHTPERYDAEKNAYKDLMLNNPAAFRALSSGKFTREQIDKKLESLYPGTRNMSRWFLGGT